MGPTPFTGEHPVTVKVNFKDSPGFLQIWNSPQVKCFSSSCSQRGGAPLTATLIETQSTNRGTINGVESLKRLVLHAWADEDGCCRLFLGWFETKVVSVRAKKRAWILAGSTTAAPFTNACAESGGGRDIATVFTGEMERRRREQAALSSQGLLSPSGRRVRGTSSA